MNRTGPHPQTGGEITAAERRAEALRRAASSKRKAAITRAETAIRQLIRNQQEINFRSVARTAGVSLDFLYANTDLRRRIETLRAQHADQTPTPAARGALEESDGNIVHILTRQLREERAARRTAVHDLEQRLAAAHGELLHLRRLMQQHGIHARPRC